MTHCNAPSCTAVNAVFCATTFPAVERHAKSIATGPTLERSIANCTTATEGDVLVTATTTVSHTLAGAVVRRSEQVTRAVPAPLVFEMATFPLTA